MSNALIVTNDLIIYEENVNGRRYTEVVDPKDINYNEIVEDNENTGIDEVIFI